MSTFASPTLRPALSKPSPLSSSLQALRSQVAFVRALLDEVERLAPVSTGDDLSEQLVDELARVGSRSLEAAAQLRKSLDLGTLGGALGRGPTNDW